MARFDHYCPFVDNGVGLANHVHFVNVLVFTTCSGLLFIHATYLYYADFDYGEATGYFSKILAAFSLATWPTVIVMMFMAT